MDALAVKPLAQRMPAWRCRAAALLAGATLILGLGRWEWQMRALGLRTMDVDDGVAQWAAERRVLASGPRDGIVILGDSRGLYDTNLRVWQQLTGRAPVQLAIADADPLPALRDLADDPRFAGLVVVGASDTALLLPPDSVAAGARVRSSSEYLGYAQSLSLSQRLDHWLKLGLSRHLAMLDSNYSLFNLLGDLPWDDRIGVVRRAFRSAGTFKLGELLDGRQAVLWRRAECDPQLRLQWQRHWASLLPTTPVSDADIGRAITALREPIARIRARGGEVVFLRPPSTGGLRRSEETILPRQRGWDRLLRETQSLGLHFEDYEDMQGLRVPDWSHLSADSARRYTRSYVSELCGQLPWLAAHTHRCVTYPGRGGFAAS
jgi:hypothetical protein